MIPSVSIIILNKDSYQDTIECLASISSLNYPNFNVVVVDNASENDSVDRLREWLSINSMKARASDGSKTGCDARRETKCSMDRAEEGGGSNRDWAVSHCGNGTAIISSNRNYGFAEGNNIGIRYILNTGHPDYVLLLNNDTIVDQEFLTQLVRATNGRRDIGIAGSAVYDYFNRDKIQSAGRTINWWLGKISEVRCAAKDRKNHDSIEVDAVSGCSMLIKREVLEIVNLLSREYFLYYEDIDFCVRARDSGYSVIYVPSSKVWHKLSSTARRNIGTREFHSTRSLFIFMKKNAKPSQFIFFRLYFFCLGLWLWAAVVTFHHRETKATIALMRGTIEGFRSTCMKR
jgi:GT2 family glycosyltransferase